MPGRGDAFVAAYSRYLRPVSGYLARRVESADVEDLAADVFTIAWRRFDQVRPGEELPWLYRIAANVVTNHRRREATRSSFLAGLRPVDSAPAAEDLVIADRGLAEAWGRLRAADREVLALAAVEELGAGEIALALGISPNAASIRLHRARRALAALLAEDPGDR